MRLPPYFKVIFWVVVVFTVLFFAASVWYSSMKNPSPEELDMLGDCRFAWKFLLGTIAGLIGGKSSG